MDGDYIPTTTLERMSGTSLRILITSALEHLTERGSSLLFPDQVQAIYDAREYLNQCDRREACLELDRHNKAVDKQRHLDKLQSEET